MLSSGTSPYCIGYINLGEEPSKRFSEAAGSVFWVSIPTGPTRGYRPKLLWPRHTTHKVSFVEVAHVAGAWRYSGSIKTGRARGLLGTRSLSSRVSPSREFTQLSAGGRYSHTGFPQIWEAWTYLQTIYPLSSAEAPAGYPHQNKIIEKIESAEERVNIR